MISGKTDYYAILGNPIEQALSPIIQNAAFEADGIDAVFLGCLVEPGQLGEAMAGVRALHFAGLAVTMPFKREIIPYLDEVSPKARALDAVNVVSVKDGRLCGHNTDGDGFVRALLSRKVEVNDRTVLLFGAGGAARGLALSLLEAGVRKLYLCNLYEAEAQEVLTMLRSCGYENVEYIPFDREKAGEACRLSTVIINATSLGMGDRPSPHMDLIDWAGIGKDTVFADVVHKPLKTPMLCKAEALGHKIITGDGMLLHQGILTYELYTGRKAPEEAMGQRLAQWLENERGR